MKKLLAYVLLVSVFLALPVFNYERSYPVVVQNETDRPVTLIVTRIVDGGKTYLYIPALETRDYVLKGGLYLQDTIACENTASGTLSIFRQTRLTFTSCYANAAPNQGEPSQEKIHLKDTPSGKLWQYQYGLRLVKQQ